jgi:hypothetical protein
MTLLIMFSFIKQDDFLMCSPTMGTTCIFITQILTEVNFFENFLVFFGNNNRPLFDERQHP